MQREARLSNVLLVLTSAISLALLALPTSSIVVSLMTLAAYCLHPAPLSIQQGLETLALQTENEFRRSYVTMAEPAELR